MPTHNNTKETLNIIQLKHFKNERGYFVLNPTDIKNPKTHIRTKN